MNQRPYTDADLRAEAARQHAGLIEDPDFLSVGEQMQDAKVGDTGKTWDELLPFEPSGEQAWNDAQTKIHDLINGAADVSEWAVSLGADGLQPHGLPLDAGENRVRVHFAFAADMTPEDRADIVAQFAAFMVAGLH